MSKKLIIAEKPTLARLIVGSLPEQSFEKKDGYYEGEDYVVTYAFGHLFQEYDIEDYQKAAGEEPTGWTLKNLPFCPPDNKFKFKLIQKRGDDGKKVADPGIKKQFLTIKSLIARKDISSIIHSGDADREGEILLRLVIRNANPTNKYVERLWVQEQTESEICKGLDSLQPDSNFDNLSNEGFARSYTDWLDGINLTRYFSLKAQAPVGHPFRIGRVICAMVREIYDRDKQIENFVPVPYYVLVSKEETNGSVIELRSKKQFAQDSLPQAQERAAQMNAADAVVTNISKQKKTINPGKLYSLTSLQNTLLKRYKMPLTTSKAAIQSVYEAGYITYPRTNTEYLGESEKDKVKSLIAIFNKEGYELAFRDGKAIFDSSKIESHSAIIPTYKIPHSLTGDELKVYETVRNRFLAVFCAEPCTVDRTTIEITCAGEKFNLRGDTMLTPGFTKYDDVSVSERVLPPLNQGDLVNHVFKAEKQETKPPAHYTATTFNNFLLAPFKKQKDTADDSDDTDSSDTGNEAVDEVSDDTALYKDIMSGVEIGTVASRTDIIAKIIANGYINENHGTYTIAPAGVYLVESMEKLRIDINKTTTAKASVMLKKVNHGEMTIDDAIGAEMDNLREIMSHSELTIPSCVETGVVKPNVRPGAEILGTCPICGGNVRETKMGYCCEHKKKEGGTCDFFMFKEDKFFKAITGKGISTAMAKKILKNKKVNVTGHSKKTGKEYPAIISFDGMKDGFCSWKLDFDDSKRKSKGPGKPYSGTDSGRKHSYPKH